MAIQLTDIVDEKGRWCGFFADRKDKVDRVHETRHYSYCFTRSFYRYAGDAVGFDFLSSDMFSETMSIDKLKEIYQVCKEFNRVYGDEK